MSIQTKTEGKDFRKQLLQWHLQDNKRVMPWKGITDPYKIWLSEIILQQTRVDQGLTYYQKFIVQYPTVQDLALAKDDDVFKLWEGLGYYSRCKNLLATARMIVAEFGGIFPTAYDAIITLKGVGPYTAAAIASFAYNLPYAVVDGNVYRVLSRYFGIETATDSTAGKKLFADLARLCLDVRQSALYNQAIMDFGATVCVPANPNCNSCPLAKNCVAFAKGLVRFLPVKTKQLIKKDRWFTYFIIETNDQVLVKKRIAKDIWQNLHEFYLYESDSHLTWNNGQIQQLLQSELDIDSSVTFISGIFIQKLTHQTIYAQFIKLKALQPFILPDGYFFQSKNELSALAFPKTITHFLQQNAVQQVIL